jgi:signal peptidase I
MPNRLARLSAVVAVAIIVAAATTHGAAVVTGGSMGPAILAGDIVLYRRGLVPGRGEAVVFEKERALVVHRALLVDERGGVVTKGDANPCEDAGVVHSEDVCGAVVAVLPLGSLLRRPCE